RSGGRRGVNRKASDCGRKTDAVSSRGGSSIRVDVGQVDKLMNLVGELVLARNQMVQFSAAREDPALQGTVQRPNLLTTELQAGVMKTRMQPIASIWNKFPRVVRDLASPAANRPASTWKRRTPNSTRASS